MKWHRIQGILMRHLYLYQRSLPRLMDIFYWPVFELLLWGFISAFIEKFHIAGFNAVTVLLGAIIFWDLLSQSQRSVSIAFLEEVWEKNFLNLFVTPLTINEFMVSSFLLGFIRILMAGTVMAGLAFLLYHFNILAFGLFLIPFVLNLLVFGWTLGLFSTAIILRFGTSAQVLAFGLISIFQPFSAVFYPVSALPESVRFIAYLIPSTHVFEGMRSVIATGHMPLQSFLLAVGTNLIYLLLTFWYFHRMFAVVKEKGLLMKLD